MAGFAAYPRGLYDDDDHNNRTKAVAQYSRPQPSAPPLASQAAALAAVGDDVAGVLGQGMAAMQGAGGVHLHVNTLNVHVHMHQQYAGGSNVGTHIHEMQPISEAAQPARLEFHSSDPPFEPISSVHGLDFGHKLVSRFYKAQKHVLPEFRMITYNQCASTAQDISHALTLHLSHKRSKLVILFFDCGYSLFNKLATEWPSTTELSNIESLLRRLGQPYECHRCKVQKERFSLYIYVIKPIGVQLSKWGQRTWNSLFHWAHNSLHHSAPVDNAETALSSVQAAIRIGLTLATLG